MERTEVLNKIFELVAEKLAEAFKVDDFDPSEAITLAMAKDLKLVEGKRGIGGGYFPTDEGLEFVGVNVEAYRKAEEQAAEAAEAAKKEAAKANKEEKAKNVIAALDDVPPEAREKVMVALFGPNKATWPTQENA